MIYNSVTQDIAPGKMAEYGEISSKELIPLFAKLGMKLVASWHGYTGNVNEVYSLFVYNDLADFQKTREAQQKNVDYQRVSAKLSAIVTRQTRTLLEPNAWSPLK
jgi:hypothetical protein